MKYIEPPSQRVPKGGFSIPPKKPKDNFWIRLLLGVMTIVVIVILSQLK